MRQVQRRVRGVAGLGQRPADLIAGELIPGFRHPRRALQLALRPRAAADQLGDRGELEGAGGGFGAVQRADHADQLIVGGAGEPALLGDPLGEPVQRRPAHGDVEALAGAEPARGAGRLAGDPGRRAGLAGAAAAPEPGGEGGYRRQVPPPGQVPGVGGVLLGDLAGLRADRRQVRIPGDRRVLRVQVLLVRVRGLVRVAQGAPGTPPSRPGHRSARRARRSSGRDPGPARGQEKRVQVSRTIPVREIDLWRGTDRYIEHTSACDAKWPSRC
jgi:hypothetical protein